ncbi:fibronectin type III domain-containing protein [Streptomyces sp. NPDC005408]|uniref:fibronectin type III domain-containing protein n=1 Tax=Streptomyces sp. NPDC005408 TaxID=3155341 RepID=UPI0033AFBF93
MRAVHGVVRALAAGVVVSAVLAGCSRAPGGKPAAGKPAGKPESGRPAARKAPADQGARLTATLDSPTDITLRWSGRDPGAAGRIVEFATEPRGPYTILQFMQPGQAAYTHPDLMPKTPFYYRLRPYYGPATSAVQFALPPGEFSEQDQKGDHKWAEPRRLPGGHGPSQSVRSTGPAAAPTGLKVTVKHANGVLLTWQDHARDEQGFLVELKPEGESAFRVAAVVDANIESMGLITLPDEKRSTVRVRAYYYGEQSNVVHRTTGPETP